MDEDMSPSFFLKYSEIWKSDWWWEVEGLFLVGAKGANGRRGLFVEIDSYAIAFLILKGRRMVTRWGLFLMRGVHFIFESIAYGKAGVFSTEDRDAKLYPFFAERLVPVRSRFHSRSSVEGAGFVAA
ncbi:hypothetical protein ACMFMG_009070 [Clarireedia jacksonii]